MMHELKTRILKTLLSTCQVEHKKETLKDLKDLCPLCQKEAKKIAAFLMDMEVSYDW